jgi:hypothetical protein
MKTLCWYVWVMQVMVDYLVKMWDDEGLFEIANR